MTYAGIQIVFLKDKSQNILIFVVNGVQIYETQNFYIFTFKYCTRYGTNVHNTRKHTSITTQTYVVATQKTKGHNIQSSPVCHRNGQLLIFQDESCHKRTSLLSNRKLPLVRQYLYLSGDM